MYFFLLLLGSLGALYVNWRASVDYLGTVMDAAPGGIFVAALFTVVEFLIPILRGRDRELWRVFAGDGEEAQTLWGLMAPGVLALILATARAADVFTTFAGLAGWNPGLSPGENLRAILALGGPADGIRLAIVLGASFFYALGPEVALLALFEAGLGHEGLHQAGLLWRFWAGVWDGIAQIPVRIRLVGMGQKRPSRPSPGPVTVGVVAIGIPVFMGVQLFNLYTTREAARGVLVPFAGDGGFWALAALIAGFQGVLWARERERGPAAWMLTSLAVDYATAWWFFIRAHPRDPATLLFGALAALFVIAPEAVLSGLLRMAVSWRRGQVAAAIAALGDFAGTFLAALREGRERGPEARSAPTSPSPNSLPGGTGLFDPRRE